MGGGGGGGVTTVGLGEATVELSATLLSTLVTVTVVGAGQDAVEAVSATVITGGGVTVTVIALGHAEVGA